MLIDLSPYLACALAELDAPARALAAAPEATLRAMLEHAVQTRVLDTEVARHNQRVCSVHGAQLADYQMRELDLGGDQRVLAAIHFFGLDVTRPFVGIAGHTRPFETARQLEELSAQLTDAFGVFAPHAIYFYQPRITAQLAHPRLWDSRRILVGRIRTLRDQPLPRAAARITLRPASVALGHAERVRYYGEFHADMPALRERVRPWDASELEPAAAEGALWTAHVDGEPAGVIAAVRASEHAFCGWLIIEEILARRFRGRGLAVPLQRALLAQLNDLGGDFVLGTIDTANHASLRTALGIGRCDVGGYSFMFAPGAQPWFEHAP